MVSGAQGEVEFQKVNSVARTTFSDQLHGDAEAGDGHHEESFKSGAITASKETVHLVGKDTWWEVGFHLVTAINNAFILGYPALIMAYLGWIAGPICLIGGGIISLYNNFLLGSLHETGGKRHIRLRDLTGHIYGPAVYKLTWVLQYGYLSIGNIGVIILSGQALKAIWMTFRDDMPIKLSTWIVIAGASFGIFAFVVPHLHALRFFSGFSLILSLIYTSIVIAISISDGLKAKTPRDYSLRGTKTDQTFNAIGALATIAFAFNTGILPEMQATVKQPSIKNMYKSLVMQFTLGALPFIVLTFVGYWAYGNTAAPYLITSLSGPKSWVTIANAAAILQAIVSLHIYATPMYEMMDTHFARENKGDWSAHNMMVRFITRGTYISLSTFFGALLPFFGDFVSLTGALAAFPLESGLVHHMYLKVKGKDFRWQRKTWHWFIIVLSAILTVITAIAAVRYIVTDSINYHAFANI